VVACPQEIWDGCVHRREGVEHSKAAILPNIRDEILHLPKFDGSS
jgi:hypothetical protein